MTKRSAFRLAIVLGSAVVLSGCEDGQLPDFLQSSSDSGSEATTRANASTRTVDRDVESPEVFQATDNGLWDGRPSLGGVWVAHPDAKDPERVIIRNEANSKFVIGVLYRPERSTPGPKYQVSSDAAEALGMLAGQPARLNVTALRREEVAVEAPAAPVAETTTETKALTAAPAVASKPLGDPVAAAAAALDAVEGKPSTPAAATAPPAAKPTPAAAPKPTGGVQKPYVQIGIFSVKTNADNTAQALRQAGMVPTIKPGKMSGKDFWRVIVGPASSASDRAAVLKKIKGLGFNDAYFVTN